MNIRLLALIFFTFCTFGPISCVKEPDFELTPKISFNKIERFIRLDQFTAAKKDSIMVSINFEDGDGDLGIDPEELLPEEGNSKDPKKKFRADDYNFIIQLFRRINGKSQEITDRGTYSGFFPKLKVDNKSEPLEGVIRKKIEIPSSFWPIKRDSILFRITIKDRAGNRSNSVDTDPVVINTI
ncbi:MAG: hypothetical protein ACRCVT_01635 [Leadbetterella sp.]